MARYGDKRSREKQKPPTFFAKSLKLVLFTGITGILLYSLLSLVQPQYRSAAILLVEEQGSAPGKLVEREMKVLASSAMIGPFLDQTALAKRGEDEGALVRMGPLRQVSLMLGFSRDPAQVLEPAQKLTRFANILSVARGDAPSTIEIGIRTASSQQAARLANQYANHYVARLAAQSAPRASKAGATQPSAEIFAQISGLRAQLSLSEASLAALEQDMRGNAFVATGRHDGTPSNAPASPIRSDNTVKLTLEELAQITAQHILAKADRDQVERRAKLVRDMLDNGGRIEGTSTVLNSGLVQALLQKRTRLEKRRTALSIDLLPAHPQMRRLDRELGGLAIEIEAETRKVVTNLDDQVSIAAARESSLKASLSKQTSMSVAEADRSFALAPARLADKEQGGIDPRIARRSALKAVIAKNKGLLMAAQGQADARKKPVAAAQILHLKATLISPAMVSRTPVFPNKQAFTLLGMLAAFLLGLGSLVLGRKNRENTRNDMAPPSADTPVMPIGEAVRSSSGDSERQPRLGFSTKPVQP